MSITSVSPLSPPPSPSPSLSPPLPLLLPLYPLPTPLLLPLYPLTLPLPLPVHPLPIPLLLPLYPLTLPLPLLPSPSSSPVYLDMIKSINDPEHPWTLEELNVLQQAHIEVDDAQSTVSVLFTPTIPHCSMATLIGLSIRVKLLRVLPERFKVRVTGLYSYKL